MSRYSIPVHQPDQYWGVAGWDSPLQTFFAIIERVDEDDSDRDPVVLWAGAKARIDTVEELERKIDQYATIPPAIKDKLYNDKAAAQPPNEFQKAMIARLTTFRDPAAQD